jgi:hypothetical protein
LLFNRTEGRDMIGSPVWQDVSKTTGHHSSTDRMNMSNIRYPRGIFALAATLAALSFGVSDVAAQTSVPTAEAQAFLGNWAVALDVDGQAFTMNLAIQDANGNLAAEVNSPLRTEPAKVNNIAKSEGNLVLSYSMDAQGQAIPVVLTLTPDGPALNAKIDLAGGMMVANGRGTKQ